MIVFAVAFAVCGFSDQTDADSSGDNDNIHWVISGDTLILSGTGNMDDYTFSTRPAWEKDSGWSNVTKAVIKSGITSIGSYVFNNCKQIVSVTLPDGITSVGSDAFSNTSINSATIPDSVISIGDRAFWQCTSLESVTLGKGLKSIGYGTFYECTKLGSVAIPDSVTSIGDSAFYNCTELGSVAISNSVTSIGCGTFYNCTKLGSVVIPDSVTSIGDSAFYNCTKLGSVAISNSVTSIGASAFYNCWYITSLTIPISLNQVGPLTSSPAFTECKNIESVVFTPGTGKGFDYTSTYQYTPWYQSMSHCSEVRIYNGVKSIGGYTFHSCGDLISLFVPNSVTSIGNSAFSGCIKLTSFDISDSVTFLGDSAFSGCISLKSVTIGKGLTSIGYGTFYNCIKLDSVAIPDSVTSIGAYAFRDCTSLSSLTIPISLDQVGPKTSEPVFAGCTNIASVVFTPGTGEGCGYESKSQYTPWYLSRTKCSEITIPDRVTSIGASAFQNCSSLVSLSIPDSVTSIGASAFQNCSSLVSLSIPISLNQVGQKKSEPAFAGCTNIASVVFTPGTGQGYSYSQAHEYTPWFLSRAKCSEITFSYGITSIGDTALSDCGAVRSLVIPDSVRSLEPLSFQNFTSLVSLTIPISLDQVGPKTQYPAFAECKNIESVVFTPGAGAGFNYDTTYQYTPWQISQEKFKKVTISDGSSYIGNSMFYGCGVLESVTIPDSVTSIGSRTFQSCTHLKSMTIPNSVTKIGSYTFQDCVSLESVVIGNGVTSLGTYAFQNCDSLSSLTAPISLNLVGRSWSPVFSQCTKIKSVVFTPGTGEGYDYSSTYTKAPWYLSRAVFREVTISDGVRSIGSCTFRDCPSITSITIPDSVRSIGSSAFLDCSALGSVVISDGLTSIGNKSFYACTSLTSIAIPKSVTSIGSSAFCACTSLASITVDGNNTAYSSEDGVLFNKAKTELIQYPAGNTRTSYTIPDSVTSLGKTAFCNCIHLTSVAVPESVTSIGNSAFSGCTSLTSITFMASTWAIDLGNESFSLGTSGMRVTAVIYSPGNAADGRLDAYGGSYTTFRYQSLMTVTFDVQGHGTAPAKQILSYGEKATRPADPTAEGYVFGGWYRESGCTNEWDFSSDTVTSDIILYAKWTAIRKVTVLVNDADWGSISITPEVTGDIIVDYGTPVSVLGNNLILGGYTVVATQNTSEKYSFAFSSWRGIPASGTVTEDIAITAVFSQTINEVRFAVNDPSMGEVSAAFLQNVPYETEVFIQGNVLTINGIKVSATSSDPTAQYTFVFDSWSGIPADHILREPVTVTAGFRAIVRTYTVTFDVNEKEWGTVGRDALQNVPYGQTVTSDGSTLTVNGSKIIAYPAERTAQYTYAFLGWEPSSGTVTGDMKVTAVFSRAVNVYTVTFDSSGGSPVVPQTVKYGQMATRPNDPVREGKAFDGWYYDGSKWDFDTPIVSDIVLVAHWNNEYVVTFDVQGHGTAPGKQTLTEGGKVTRPPDPTDEGYLFGGWYRESSATNPWNFETDTVQDSMTLYAKWTLGECRISSDRSTWTYFATLGEGLQGCSDGWYLELMDSCPHSEVTIDKSITVIFSGKTFYSQHTVLKISADVTFTGMNQMPLSATFATGACLTVDDTEFPLTASFADVAEQAGKVFVRGLTANDVSVAHGGYSADGTSDAITLVRVTDFPYAVLDGGVFVFYATIGEAIGRCTDGHVYVLNYIPVYSGGTQVRTYDANASVDDSIVLGTVTRVTDGVHSSFYIGTMEVYNNGASVGIPSGKVMYAEVGGELRIAAGRVLTITDVAAVQDIILGGGRTDLLGEDPVAIVRLTETAPSVRLTIGFENIGSWIVRTQTPEGYVYELKDGCDYTFITSDRMSLNDMVSVKAPGFKANIGPEGFSGKLVASQSIVAYVRTGESSYTGYGSIGEAIAAATAAGQYDSTVYLLYRTTDRTEDQPTIVHVMDSDLVFDGTFKLATVHQHVDAAGTNSTYSVDGSMAVLRFTEGHGIRINSDADLSKVLIEGVVNIQGANVIDLVGNWDSKILTLKLYAHEIGTVVKNAGDVQWNVISYPEEGCSLSKQGNDLVLSGPAPAPSSGGSPIIIICALAGIIIPVIAAMCIVMVKRRS